MKLNNFSIGSGWLTIKFREVRGAKLWDNTNCDFFSACDPFIRLSIDGKPQFDTESRTNTDEYDVNVIYTTPKISKNATIKIEMFDDNGDNNPPLILRAEGSVDSFLRDGFRSVPITLRTWRSFTHSENFFDTISFWQDEHKYKYKNANKKYFYKF